MLPILLTAVIVECIARTMQATPVVWTRVIVPSATLLSRHIVLILQVGAVVTQLMMD
jgi:hypothetical protein